MNAEARGTYTLSGYGKQKALEGFTGEFKRLSESVDRLTEANRRACRMLAALFMGGVLNAGYEEDASDLKARLSGGVTGDGREALMRFIDGSMGALEDDLDRRRETLFGLALEAYEKGDTGLACDLVDAATGDVEGAEEGRRECLSRLDETLGLSPVSGGGSHGGV